MTTRIIADACLNHMGSLSPSVIQRTVYALRDEFPDIFGRYVFNTNRVYPYSEELEDDLMLYHLYGVKPFDPPDAFWTLANGMLRQ